MFINISIFSKNYKSINRFLVFFKHFIKQQKSIHFFKSFQKKEKVKKITILKSPHVNKKAQEQFETRIISKKIVFCSFQLLKTLVLLKKIKHKLFPDIKISINFLFSSKKQNQLKIRVFDPDIFSITQSNNSFKFNTKKYLRLFDIFGTVFFKKRLGSSVGRAKD